jgi:hypothetical protein
MAGYTRQSTASIINGSPITAPPLNAEFNQLLAAFNATTGHSHDGSTGNSPKINLATSVSGYLPAEHGGSGGANKMDATTAPLTTNDNTEGYAPGSLWENTTNGRIYICVGSTTNAAVWRELVQVITDNVIKPISYGHCRPRHQHGTLPRPVLERRHCGGWERHSRRHSQCHW